MSLSDLVNVQIDLQTSSVSRVGFGTPLVMSSEAYEDVRFGDTAKVYTALSELGATGDNYDTAGVTYKMAQTIFSQNPKVSQLVIGKRANPSSMLVNLIPIVKANTDYIITIGGRGVTGADEEIFTIDSGGAPTVASILGLMATAVNGGAQKVLATDNTTDMDIEPTAVAGTGPAVAVKPYTIQFDRNLWTAQNSTLDVASATDLTTIRDSTDGNDDWYALFMDSFGKAEIVALAAAIEATQKIYLPTTFDADVLTAATTDVGSLLQASNRFRTAVQWHTTPGYDDLSAAWAGKNLPKDPGSITWKFKSVSGPVFNKFTSAEISRLKTKSVNYYIRKAGNNMMAEGVMAGGEFIDIVRGIDFVSARLQENVFSQMINKPKIPMTDDGIGVVESEVRGVMDLAIAQSIFAADPAPVVTVPLAADISTNDKANRFLPNVTFSATLAGAIHATEIFGTVTP